MNGIDPAGDIDENVKRVEAEADAVLKEQQPYTPEPQTLKMQPGTVMSPGEMMAPADADPLDAEISELDLGSGGEVKPPESSDPLDAEISKLDLGSDLGVPAPTSGGNIPEPSAEQKAYNAMPLYEKVTSNTTNLLKANVGRFGALVNAGGANLNEVFNVDSELYRENQTFWKGLSDQAIKELEPAYGDKKGWKMTVAKEFANPLNYLLLSSVTSMSGVVGTDVSAENAVGENAGEGVDQSDTNSVALGMGAGIIIGKLIEPTVRIMGEASTGVLDMWRLRGLPDNVKQVLKEGTPEDLTKLLTDMKLSEDLGAGFLPMGGKASATTNIFEANRAHGLGGVVDRVEREAVKLADDILNRGDPLEVAAETVYTAAKAKEKTLQDPMKEAYNNSIHKASVEPQYDMKEVNQGIIDVLRDEGAPDPVISHVMKQLYSKGRHLTPDEKAATKELGNLQAQLAQAEKKVGGNKTARPGLKKRIAIQQKRLEELKEAGKKTTSAWDTGKLQLKELEDQYILGGSTNQQLGGKITQLKNKLGNLKSQMPETSDLFSERELINSVRGITHKMTTAGGDISIGDDVAQFWMAKAKRQLGDAVGPMFKENGSEIFTEFSRANGLAKKYYDYANGMKEMQQLLTKGEVLPEEVLTNLLQNPVRLRQAINLIDDPEVGGDLARQMVSNLTSPTSQIGVGLEKLDMKATSKKLNSIFNDKGNVAFLKKHLPAGEFRQVNSLKDVISDFTKMTDALPPEQGIGEYLTGAGGITTTVGRFMKVAYDGVGYMKNSLLETVGRQAGKSRVIPHRETSFTNTTQMKQAMNLVTKKLRNAGPDAPEGFKLPDLTRGERKVVNKAIESMAKWKVTSRNRPGFIKGQAVTTTVGAGTGAVIGASEAPEGHKLEGATAGALVGAGLGMAAGKGMKGYEPGKSNILGGEGLAVRMGKGAEYKQAVSEMQEGKLSKHDIYGNTGMVVHKGEVHMPVKHFWNRITAKKLTDKPQPVSEIFKDASDDVLKEYPELANVDIAVNPNISSEGVYHPAHGNTKALIEVKEQFSDSVPHEIQHALQQISDAPQDKRGSNPRAYIGQAKAVVDYMEETLGTMLSTDNMKTLVKYFKEEEVDPDKLHLVKKQFIDNGANPADVIALMYDLKPYTRYATNTGEQEARMASKVAMGDSPFPGNMELGQYMDEPEAISKAFLDKNAVFGVDIIKPASKANEITNEIAKSYPEGSMEHNIYTTMEFSVDAGRIVDKLQRGEGSIVSMPLKKRQQALDTLLTTDMKDGMGAVGYTQPGEIDYRGFTMRARPNDFRNLAADSDKAMDTSSIAKGVADGKKIGEPFLTVKYDPATNTMHVSGHEGRHRMEYIKETFGGDVDIPIHIVTMREMAEDGADYEMRNRHIPKDVVGSTTKWVDEEGNRVKGGVSSKFKYNLYQMLGITAGAGAISSPEANAKSAYGTELTKVYDDTITPTGHAQGGKLDFIPTKDRQANMANLGLEMLRPDGSKTNALETHQARKQNRSEAFRTGLQDGKDMYFASLGDTADLSKAEIDTRFRATHKELTVMMKSGNYDFAERKILELRIENFQALLREKSAGETNKFTNY